MTALILLVALVCVHVLGGMKFGLYRYPVFEGLTHVLGGCWLAALGFDIVSIVYIACAWEVFEFLFDRFLPAEASFLCWHSRSLDLAYLDVFATVAGALLWITRL